MSRHLNRTMLCVGGPRAGQRFDARDGPGFAVPVLRPLASVSLVNLNFDAVPMVETVEYRQEVFQSPEGDVAIWVPHDQTALATFMLLLDCYEQTHRQDEAKKPSP